VAVICLLPVALPLLTIFFSGNDFADDGQLQFIRIADQIYLGVIVPLIALFFATMLVGEEAESQTMAYVLTRATPRSAWVLGRFLGYVAVAGGIMSLAILLAYAACSVQPNLGWGLGELKMLAHFLFATVMGLVAYGALMVLLGAVTRHAVILGIFLIYAWQPLALLAPGLLENFTIKSYINKLVPSTAVLTSNVRSAGEALNPLDVFSREVYLKEAAWSVFALVCISGVFLGLTILTVRTRQYAKVKASG
jgi:ABC-type transport system involved in multi-copper enzyme maturation permease subunit